MIWSIEAPWKLSNTLLELIEDLHLSQKECANVFEDFDKDESGKLSHKDFKKSLKELKIRASHADVEDLIDDMDRDGDGYVSYKEFMDAIFAHKRGKRRKKHRYSDEDSSDEYRERDSRGAGGEREGRNLLDRAVAAAVLHARASIAVEVNRREIERNLLDRSVTASLHARASIAVK